MPQAARLDKLLPLSVRKPTTPTRRLAQRSPFNGAPMSDDPSILSWENTVGATRVCLCIPDRGMKTTVQGFSLGGALSLTTAFAQAPLCTAACLIATISTGYLDI